MKAIVDCKNLKGNITVPISKSWAHRYLLASFLANNMEAIRLFSFTSIAEDLLATKKCIENFQVGNLDCNESGTTLRFMLAIAAAIGGKYEITARGSLIDRPNDELINELINHGTKIHTNKADSKITYCLDGKLTSGKYELSGNISSQYLSALLFSLPLLEGDSEITIKSSIKSRPYVDMTLLMLETFGIDIVERENRFFIKGNQKYTYPKLDDICIEGDWSSGAMWLVASKLLNGAVTVNGLSEDSIQADVFILDLLEIEDGLDVIFSILDCPDLAPAAVLWAVSRDGKTTILDVSGLKIKECDRLNTIVSIFTQFGAKIKNIDDKMIIEGNAGRLLESSNYGIDCKGDHRMIMLASLMSIISKEKIIIDNPEAVRKSYPNFFEDIVSLGGKVEWN